MRFLKVDNHNWSLHSYGIVEFKKVFNITCSDRIDIMNESTSFKNTLRGALDYVKEVIDADLAMKNNPTDDNCDKEIRKIYSMKFPEHLGMWNILAARGIGTKETQIRKCALQSLPSWIFPS